MNRFFAILIFAVLPYCLSGCASSGGARVDIEMPSFTQRFLGPKMNVVVSNKLNLYFELYIIGDFVGRIGPGGVAHGSYRCGIENAPVPMLIKAYSDPLCSNYVGAAMYSQNAFSGYPVLWEIRNISYVQGIGDAFRFGFGGTNPVGGSVEINVPSVGARSIAVLQVLNNTKRDAVVRLIDHRGEVREVLVKALGGFYPIIIENFLNGAPVGVVLDVAFIDENGNSTGGFSYPFYVPKNFPQAVQILLN